MIVNWLDEMFVDQYIHVNRGGFLVVFWSHLCVISPCIIRMENGCWEEKQSMHNPKSVVF